MCNKVRVPIKVVREPIKSSTGRSIGGWFAFPMPRLEPSPPRKLKNSERQLWCPYCGEWTIFSKTEVDRWYCDGVCGWANTSEFYVRTFNSIWYEDIPTAQLAKMSIPSPSSKRK